jgi:uncharacterized protein DUF6457
MDAWEDTFATAIGEDPVTPEELGIVLRLSRDVAHRVERKLAPVSAYLAGVHAGRLAATGGGARAEGLRAAERAARAILPEAELGDEGA